MESENVKPTEYFEVIQKRAVLREGKVFLTRQNEVKLLKSFVCLNFIQKALT